MRTSRRLVLAALSVFFLASQPGAAHAQNVLSLDFRGGASVGSGDLGDLMDTSPSFGFAADLPLTSRLDVRIMGVDEVWSGADIEQGVGVGREVADLNLVHGLIGLKYQLAEPGSGGFFLDVHAGGGGTVVSSDKVSYSTGQGGTVIVDMSTVYPMVGGGLELGWNASRSTSLFVGGEGLFVLSDEEETQDISRLGAIGDAEGLSSMVSLPLYAGIRFRFPK